MFKTILDEAATGEAVISGKDSIICLLVALGLGLVIAGVYMFSQRKRGVSSGFAFSLVIIPAVVTVIIMLVGSNVARAFSLAGAFSLVRFRSAPGEAKDITYIFLAMALGLATGMGYILTAAVFVGIICMAMIILSCFSFGRQSTEKKTLKITIPEDLNYEDCFDELLEKYTESYSLDRVKTINMGTLFELTYLIVMKPESSQKEFIDEIRARNGNLGISILRAENEVAVAL